MVRAQISPPSTPKRTRVRSSTPSREIFGPLQCAVRASVARPLHVSKRKVESSRGVGIGKENIPPSPLEAKAARLCVVSRGHTSPGESSFTSK